MLCLVDKTKTNDLFLSFPSLMEFGDRIFLFETQKAFLLPRHFKKHYPKDYITQFIDKNFHIQEIDIDHSITLKPEQEKLINTIFKEYQKTNTLNGIIRARPGFGKTVCAAYLTALTKMKTLVILDNSKLVEQWIDSYLKFTTLKEDDIGFIIGKKFDNKPVTIAMVQTLLSRTKRNFDEFKDFYRRMRDCGFGLVFYDEMHKTSSATNFAKSTIFLQTPHIIGLTATPYGDKLHQFFMKTIFSGVYEKETDNVSLDYISVNYSSGIAKQKLNRLDKFTDQVKKVASYNKLLVESPNYFRVIHELVKKNLEEDRKTIIVVFTIEQLQAISDYLTGNNIEVREFYSKKRFIDKENDKVIVAVYKYASHGFDHSDLSSLILASPLFGKVSLVQTVGRILRSKNHHPTVYDLIDKDMEEHFSFLVARKKSILRNEFTNINFYDYDFR